MSSQRNDGLLLIKPRNIYHSLPKHCRHLYLLSPFPYMSNDKNLQHINKQAKTDFPLFEMWHRYHIFPTASCSSYDYNDNRKFSRKSDYDDEDSGLSLPGIKRNRNTASVAVGEYEINQFMESESGWDRVKYMYRTESGLFQDESTLALNTMLYRTVVIGFFINAMVGSAKLNKAEKSLSKTEAMKKGSASQVLIPKQILMTALKDTFKLSVLTFSLLHVSQTIAAYRNKTSVWEFVFSSAVGFGAIGISQGVSKFGIYTLAGALAGSVGGLVVCQVLEGAGLTQEVRSMKKMQKRAAEQRMLTTE